MNIKCKVSVIVPVYNAARYLDEMVNSLLAQTLKEIEFIFVDDCSTDNSVEILYEFEKKDTDRIIIISLDENQGPGGARNVGLQYASGEYIAFADSDDYVKPEMYECMYEKAIQGDYDLVECGYFSERNNRDMLLWDSSMEGEVSFDSRVKMLLSCGFLWSKLYRRSIIMNPEIEFISKIQYEDVDFLSRLYCSIQKVGVVNQSLYFYRNNPASFSNKGNTLKYFDINNTFCKRYLENIKKEPLYNHLQPVIEYVILGIWFDMFKAYVTQSPEIDINSLQAIDMEIKKYVSNYGENLFLVEKAKHDLYKEAFLVNAFDSRRAVGVLGKIEK